MGRGLHLANVGIGEYRPLWDMCGCMVDRNRIITGRDPKFAYSYKCGGIAWTQSVIKRGLKEGKDAMSRPVLFSSFLASGANGDLGGQRSGLDAKMRPNDRSNSHRSHPPSVNPDGGTFARVVIASSLPRIKLASRLKVTTCILCSDLLKCVTARTRTERTTEPHSTATVPPPPGAINHLLHRITSRNGGFRNPGALLNPEPNAKNERVPPILAPHRIRKKKIT
jgi:hypothetical protein